MRHIERSSSFKRNYKVINKRGYEELKMAKLIELLANDASLPLSCKDHPLKGRYTGFRDCHIEPDWLLIYQKSESEDGLGILFLEATGTHSDLFQ